MTGSGKSVLAAYVMAAQLRHPELAVFVIDPQGKIVYAGAIDDRPSTRPEDPPAANNYVRAALTQATGGLPVTTATTTPYGCSIKY